MTPSQVLGTCLLKLSLSLYAKLHTEHNDDNVLFSPYSLGTALSVIRDGARRITEREISDIFQYHYNLHEHFKKFLSDVASYAPNVTCHVASRMLSDYRYKVQQEYMSLLEDYYSTSVRLVDFKERAENVRVEANAWVSKHTRYKIKNLLPPESVSATTTLVLMNAIYFKGFWEFPFQKTLSRPQTFHSDSSKSVTVKMMNQMGSFKVGRSEELKSRAVEMLYKGRKCSMVIILPDDVEGLSLLEEKLSESSLCSLLANLTTGNDVQLTIPKFTLEAGQSMKDTLRAMGAKNLFEEGEGDLSGIFEEVMTALSDMVHKVLLEVDEGTEAAADTAAVEVGSVIASPGRVTHFVVDHPFMFLIRSIEPDMLLFVGSVRKL